MSATYNANANTSGIRGDPSPYGNTYNSGISGNVGTSGINAGYNANANIPAGSGNYNNVPAGSGIYNNANAGSNYYASGAENARDTRQVSYTTNNNTNNPSSQYPYGTSNVEPNRNTTSSNYVQPAAIRNSSTAKNSDESSGSSCPTPLLALLGLIAIAGIVLGILFGVGVIGGKNIDLHPPSSGDSENSTPGYSGENAVEIDGVNYEPYSVTVETTIIDTSNSSNSHMLNWNHKYFN